MIVSAWRIVKARHAAAAFTGAGAKLSGGRWNSPGVPMIYAAGSASLAMLEMLVHLQSQELLNRYVLFEVSFDERHVQTLATKSLPKAWKKSPPTKAVQQIGDEWASALASPVLKVPSVILPTESNYLLNPAHPHFAKIAIGPKRNLRFDPRLF